MNSNTLSKEAITPILTVIAIILAMALLVFNAASSGLEIQDPAPPSNPVEFYMNSPELLLIAVGVTAGLAVIGEVRNRRQESDG